jgi:tetratricopeptide (TPR) repeat protein
MGASAQGRERAPERWRTPGRFVKFASDRPRFASCIAAVNRRFGIGGGSGWRSKMTAALAVLGISLWALPLLAAADSSVTLKEENIVIPTYAAGDPEPNPMFYFGRNSQGAAGRVYPYPLYDTLTHVKTNKTYHIVYLENEYIRIGILPEIGGRLFEAVDKSNGYDFIYHQHVIKPALIGLIGAWMSGGIEWNIPHHHRASTFLPVQYTLATNADGGKTIWVGELELRQRMRWAVGYTLHPGKSYLECSVRILNRTPFPNTMLCFANVAVHVNDNYQVIFPPDTQYVTYHGKKDFATWPIATGRYSGADFGDGTDVSWYSNHVSANSMFAWNYEDNFFAGYDHGKQAGILSIADHHFVPGKKFWTWGNGPRGRMWDHILTDDDGPYIELMVGAYSDNQPDYSWLQPYETKSFQMYWYPFRDIDGVKNANLDAAVNLVVNTNNTAKVGFCVTSAHDSATVNVTRNGTSLLEEKIAISPGKSYVKTISLPAGVNATDLRASLTVDGQELVAYAPVKLAPMEMPKPVTGPPPPPEIKTVEELYLAGQRIEQFNAPAASPEPYWDEALRRDPVDARVNTSYGIRQLKEARFAEAEQHFRNAIERLAANYTSPKDGEPYYYLGIALKAQDKTKEAEDAFAKATWSEAWRSPAYFSLAEIAAGRSDFGAALDDVNRSLDGNGLNLRAFTLKAAALRHLGRTNEALAVLDLAAQKTDPLDVRLVTERWLAGETQVRPALVKTLADLPATGLETAAEFADAGLHEDATGVLDLMSGVENPQKRISPLVYYWLQNQVPRSEKPLSMRLLQRSASGLAEQSPEYVFPFQWEMVPVLREAMKSHPKDAHAPYYLGNLLFDWQPEEALKLWEQSAKLDPNFAIVHRNIATALIHQNPSGDTNRAIVELEKAVACPVKFAMHFTELDELYAATGAAPDKRLALLEKNHDVVLKRDDALSREIGLKVFAGKYDDAINLMTGRVFSVWEGGSLDVTEHWVTAHLGRARQELAAKQFAQALADLQATKAIPDNLPSDGRGTTAHDAEIAYWSGVAYDGLGDKAKAAQSWQQAQTVTVESGGGRRGGRAGGTSDRQAVTFYQEMARRAQGQTAEAEKAFHALLDNALHASDASASSPPSASAAASTHYAAGLGHLGLGEKDQARTEFELALRAVPDSLGPKMELAQLR